MYKVALDLADGSTVVYENVVDYDIDDSDELEDLPEEEPEEETTTDEEEQE
jgi:hypothetical protein